jgi:hypothetical protein
VYPACVWACSARSGASLAREAHGRQQRKCRLRVWPARGLLACRLLSRRGGAGPPATHFPATCRSLRRDFGWRWTEGGHDSEDEERHTRHTASAGFLSPGQPSSVRERSRCGPHTTLASREARLKQLSRHRGGLLGAACARKFSDRSVAFSAGALRAMARARGASAHGPALAPTNAPLGSACVGGMCGGVAVARCGSRAGRSAWREGGGCLRATAQ